MIPNRRGVDLSRFWAAQSARLSHLALEGIDWRRPDGGALPARVG